MADLIVFGEDWGGLPSSTQHLVKHLLKDNRVIWVNSVSLRNPRMNIKDISRAFKKVIEIIKLKTNKQHKNKQCEDTPYIISPKIIPFHGYSTFRKFNKISLRYSLKKLMNTLDFNETIIWISIPSAEFIVGEISEKAVIYYCCDDFSALDGVDHKIITPIEKNLADKSDIIFTANQKLADKFSTLNPIMLPHGVDYTLFSTPQKKPLDLPNSNNIAGFYGSISEWLDVKMLANTAQQLAHWQFVFIGSIKTDVSSLKKLSNVHFLGVKNHSLLPAYVQNWNIAMLPFFQNEQIYSCSPLKLKEYLASGTPIVSTDFPEAQKYGDIITIKQHNESFADTIERSFSKKVDPKDQQKAIASESWQSRIKSLQQIIDKLTEK